MKPGISIDRSMDGRIVLNMSCVGPCALTYSEAMELSEIVRKVAGGQVPNGLIWPTNPDIAPELMMSTFIPVGGLVV